MLICGIDEAGRGPLAGPVTAAAVILPEDFPTEILADSKALAPQARRAAALVIQEQALAWAVGWADNLEIDRLNILWATMLAMERAFHALALKPDEVLVDGNRCPNLDLPCRALVKGDATVPAIMAASILAKTSRDAWMEAYDREDSRYGFSRHKGYPTQEHRRLLALHGPSVIHRRSFSPVARQLRLFP